MTSQKGRTTDTITGPSASEQEEPNDTQGLPYAVGDVCMVSQTPRCLQYHPARITNIKNTLFAVTYLTTSLSDVIPEGVQKRTLRQVGRGVKRRSERPVVRQEKLHYNYYLLQSPQTSLYQISLARWKRQRKHHLWGKEGKVADNNKTYYCVPVTLTVLGVFWTPREAIHHLNNAAMITLKKDVAMTTTITDHSTMWCPRAIHLAITAMGWTMRKLKKLQGQKHFDIASKGMFKVVGIQNTIFKVGTKAWNFNLENNAPEQQQPGLNRHAVAVIDGNFFHYDVHDGTLRRYPIHLLVGKRQDEQKYLVRVEKVYEVRPKHQPDWQNRGRHVHHVSLNIGCICVGNLRCTLNRWEERCSNDCPCIECGGQWDESNDKDAKFGSAEG